MITDDEYIALSSLATKLNLPCHFLKRLAENGEIPSLNVNGRLRFNPEAVRQSLDNLAEKRCAGG